MGKYVQFLLILAVLILLGLSPYLYLYLSPEKVLNATFMIMTIFYSIERELGEHIP